MISTLERENSIDGMLFGKMKELPDWYGLTGVGFIWHGEWNDPEIDIKESESMQQLLKTQCGNVGFVMMMED